MNGESHRHHFVPQFYVRTWYESDCDGFCLYFRDKQNRIRLWRRSARAVAFVHDLYSLQPDGLGPRESSSDELEKNFFSRIDSAAGAIYDKLLSSGVTSISAEERPVWALFVNSLLERSPKRIREIESKASDVLDKSIAELERRWRNPSTWPAMKASLLTMNKTAAARNAALTSLTSYIVDQRFIEYVASMAWQIIELRVGADHFLTGDTPIVVNAGGSAAPIYMLSMALSPRRLLVMHTEDKAFDVDFFAMLAMGHNIVITKQTEKYLVSSRELADSHHIKYTRIAAEMLGINDTKSAIDESSDLGPPEREQVAE